ncbi:hypothetical protein [Streptomyces sp. NPDC102360]|uniref:hypothetical protein n=1 Tax=Streptomyces sp. NPDC102360 TaxID=3366160 RepID=UPI0037F697D3
MQIACGKDAMWQLLCEAFGIRADERRLFGGAEQESVSTPVWSASAASGCAHDP